MMIVALPIQAIGDFLSHCILIPCKVTVAPALIVTELVVDVLLFDCVIIAVVLAGTVTFPFAKLYVVAAWETPAAIKAINHKIVFIFIYNAPFS